MVLWHVMALANLAGQQLTVVLIDGGTTAHRLVVVQARHLVVQKASQRIHGGTFCALIGRRCLVDLKHDASPELKE